MEIGSEKEGGREGEEEEEVWKERMVEQEKGSTEE